MVGFYKNLAQQLGYGLGSALLIAILMLMGSMKKWLQNRGIMRGRKVEIKGLRTRHTGMQEQLCQLQQTRHGKCVITPMLPPGGVRRQRRQ